MKIDIDFDLDTYIGVCVYIYTHIYIYIYAHTDAPMYAPGYGLWPGIALLHLGLLPACRAEQGAQQLASPALSLFLGVQGYCSGLNNYQYYGPNTAKVSDTSNVPQHDIDDD